MTSENEAKTNELQRRRKLRLQQVREQSKDIAKKLRQRAKLERLGHILDIDSKKASDYLLRQNNLVKRLEELYAQGVKHVGESHLKASKEILNVSPEKVDLSQIRGKEAAAELRKKRQKVLDDQKKLLDRKLQAREAANEISREKSSSIVKKSHATENSKQDLKEVDNNAKDDDVASTTKGITNMNDMATQWNIEEVPNEWETSIPTLSLPKDDNSIKDFTNVPESKSEKSKRIDLFAVSSEMPSSLRGGSSNKVEQNDIVKPSMTIVSEYLQSRALRLRESDLPILGSKKKPMDDIQSIKQTILHTRALKIGGTASNVCHVLDEQVIPIPSWQADSDCEFLSKNINHHSCYKNRPITLTNSQINKIYKSVSPVYTDLNPTPILRGCSPFRRSKVYPRMRNDSANENNKSGKSSAADSLLTKKNFVSVYNHSTRNCRDIPCHDVGLVVRDNQEPENAYSQAILETSNDNSKEKEGFKKIQELRGKVAMTKQMVEKEYHDTMSFLKTIPKEKCSKHKKTFYMDGKRQHMLKTKHQKKLEEEFTNIEKDHRRNCGKDLRSKNRRTTHNNGLNPHTSSNDLDSDLEAKDSEYSWLPVPDGDGSLAIHTIPTTVKEMKTGNSVKFSNVDSYHEYRSRHKHTPPTKDTNRDTKRKTVETVLIQDDISESLESSDNTSVASSVENLNLQKNQSLDASPTIAESEKIIVYKILKSKKRQKDRKKLKLIDDVAKVLKSMERNKLNDSKHKDPNNKSCNEGDNRTVHNSVLEKINEGVYKVVNEKGDNITSLYCSEKPHDKNNTITDDPRSAKANWDKPIDKDNSHTGNGDIYETRNSNCDNCTSSAKYVDYTGQQSAATSTSSFKTAATTKLKQNSHEEDYFKLLNNDGQATEKFYIGASGLLKDDAYEVIIQLRKKDPLNHTSGKISSDHANTEEVDTSNVNLKNSELITKESNPAIEILNMEELKNNNDPCKLNPIISESSPRLHADEMQSSTEPRDSGETLINVDANNVKSSVKHFAEKGEYTTSQLSFVTPSDFPKTDPVPKPVISTYTQTTLNSPNTRAAFIHMSSSTSTAYMSPPEMVLPKCLQRPYSEMYYIKDLITSQDDVYDNNEYSEYEKKYKECTCHRCRRHKNHTVTNERSTKRVKKHTKKLNTENNYSDTCTAVLTRNVHKYCHKYANRDTTTESNQHKQSKKVSSSKRTSLSPIDVNSKTNKNIFSQANKSKLNPTIKSYVHKLLELNKNGLKAIKIANQDCSSVSTPGSSVIDVPQNINKNNADIDNKISLEQIKDTLRRQILHECFQENDNHNKDSCNFSKKSKTCISKGPRMKRSVHKVKSLNISKNILKTRKPNNIQTSNSHYKKSDYSTSSPSFIRNEVLKKPRTPISTKTINRRRDWSSPKYARNFEFSTEYNSDNIAEKLQKKKSDATKSHIKINKYDKIMKSHHEYNLPFHKATITSTDSENKRTDNPINTSTQTTSQDLDSETNIIKLAEDKILNMEKIADLTEKCTKRLSNLAKVLEEVRRSKSLAYSQISTSDTGHTSGSEQKSNKNETIESNSDKQLIEPQNILVESPASSNGIKEVSEYVPLLLNIPRPVDFKHTDNSSELSQEKDKLKSYVNIDDIFIKTRGKPPPALSRVNLKHGKDIIPHELSTVIEVESPMSLKLKNLSSKDDIVDSLQQNYEKTGTGESKSKDRSSPDILVDNINKSARQNKSRTNNSSDESKLQMMDIKQFNDVMLKPFITLQEYATQCNFGVLDDGSNIDEHVKDELLKDELSSLHSDGSLPDVIAELLKRNLIAEPFKFDTASNENTVSSESTLSILALSKTQKAKKKPSVVFHNKENISETSDSLSMSSNPDLENAFKRLGMGWASSTLKKTKERLALSSSSNTSSSSLSQFKLKTVNEDIPAIVTDSVSSMNKTTKRQKQAWKSLDTSKNVEQQTSLVNSMTVKEFLTNELANKITFTNKSNKNTTDDEFISLQETKIPDEMKYSQNLIENQSSNSLPNGNNRARTSTPVQIFKSMTYHSTSSSNISNGLFSNADDLSSVKGTSNSIRNHSTSDKDDLTIPNCSLKVRKPASDCST